MSKDAIRMIEDLNKQLKDYIEKDIEWKKQDTIWKQEMEPVKAAFDRSKWGYNFLVAGLKFLGILGSAVAAIVTIYKILTFHK